MDGIGIKGLATYGLIVMTELLRSFYHKICHAKKKHPPGPCKACIAQLGFEMVPPSAIMIGAISMSTDADFYDIDPGQVSFRCCVGLDGPPKYSVSN